MRGVLKMALLAGPALFARGASAAECDRIALAAYTQLGLQIREIQDILEADLLGIELLTHVDDNCRFAFVVEFLDSKDRVDAAIFEAITLEPIFYGFDDWEPVDIDALADAAEDGDEGAN